MSYWKPALSYTDYANSCIWNLAHIINPILPGGGGHIVPALTLTNYNLLDEYSPNLVTFPKIYQRKFSCVNDVSMMIDVSIATVFSEVYFDYFLSFSVFFQVFPIRL